MSENVQLIELIHHLTECGDDLFCLNVINVLVVLVYQDTPDYCRDFQLDSQNQSVYVHPDDLSDELGTYGSVVGLAAPWVSVSQHVFSSTLWGCYRRGERPRPPLPAQLCQRTTLARPVLTFTADSKTRQHLRASHSTTNFLLVVSLCVCLCRRARYP